MSLFSNTSIISIVSGGTGIGYFSINASSCEVHLAQELDFEKVEGYDLVIQAFDLDPNSSRSTSTTFTIEVIDVNEFTPVSYQSTSNQFEMKYKVSFTLGNFELL